MGTAEAAVPTAIRADAGGSSGCEHERGRLTKLVFSHWPIWPAQEAFGDPKSPGNKPSNEGHGFSRAVDSRRLTASAAEVRFFESYGGKVISFASEFVFNATRERVAIQAPADQLDQPDLVRPSSLQDQAGERDNFALTARLKPRPSLGIFSVFSATLMRDPGGQSHQAARHRCRHRRDARAPHRRIRRGHRVRYPRTRAICVSTQRVGRAGSARLVEGLPGCGSKIARGF